MHVREILNLVRSEQFTRASTLSFLCLVSSSGGRMITSLQSILWCFSNLHSMIIHLSINCYYVPKFFFLPVSTICRFTRKWYWNTCNSSNTHFKNFCSIEDDSIYSTELLKYHESKCNHESPLSFFSPECFKKWQFLGSYFINCCLYLLKFSADIIIFSCMSNEKIHFLQTNYTWHTYFWSHATHFKVNFCNAGEGKGGRKGDKRERGDE